MTVISTWESLLRTASSRHRNGSAVGSWQNKITPASRCQRVKCPADFRQIGSARHSCQSESSSGNRSRLEAGGAINDDATPMMA